MPRLLAGLTAVLVSLSLVAPAEARPTAPTRSATSVTGHWVGTVRDDSGAGSPYRARVRIYRSDTGRLHGRITYPGPGCSGRWAFRRKAANGWYHFLETITRDPGKPTCIQRLEVKVRRRDARLKIVWTSHARTESTLARRS